LPGLRDIVPGLRDLVPGFLKEKKSPSGSEETYAVGPSDLNRLVDCSLTNAVMDTAFMLVHLTPDRAWIPMHFLYEMEKCEIQGIARVRYILDQDVAPFCLPDEACPRKMGIDAFLKYLDCIDESPFLEITVSPVFRSTNYGSMDSAIRGKWATAKNDQGMSDVRALLQMPWSGTVMKQRLIKHTAEVERSLRLAKENPDIDKDDPMYQKYLKWLEGILSRLKEVAKKIPDGLPDHFFCVGSVSRRSQAAQTVLSESENEREAGELRPRNILKAMRKSSGKGGAISFSALLSAWEPRPLPSCNFRPAEGFPGRLPATQINNRLRTDID
jgi:hypothetical protein